MDTPLTKVNLFGSSLLLCLAFSL